MELSKKQYVQETLAQNYENAINSRREKYFTEKQNSIIAEQERLAAIEQEVKDEKESEIRKRNNIKNMQYNDLQRVLEERKVKNIQWLKDKKKIDNLSLNLTSDEDLKNLYNKIINNSKKTDLNTKNFIEYIQTHPRQKNFLQKAERKEEQNIYISPQVARKQYTKDILGCMKPHTDVTARYNDKYNNPDYLDYRVRNREYQDYNKNIFDNSRRERYDYESQRELIEKDNQYINDKENEGKMYMLKRKNDYKSILDEQRSTQVLNKLASENMTINQVNINPQYFKETFTPYHNDKFSPNYQFINRNRFVEVNPCKFIYLFILLL